MPRRTSWRRNGNELSDREKVKKQMATKLSARWAPLAGLLFLVGGCSVGPVYHTPAVTTPPAYKELTPEQQKQTDGWKVAQPKDDALHGKWWEIFGDPELNALEDQVNVSNQNIAMAAANFQAARALVRESAHPPGGNAPGRLRRSDTRGDNHSPVRRIRHGR